MECSEEIRILLAGYVDGELTPVERQTVEEHLRDCSECRALLEEQEAAVAAYAAYPVEAAADADWGAMWSRLEGRLPQPAKRVRLERLAEMDVGDEFTDRESVDAEAAAPAAPPAPPPPIERPEPSRPQEQAPPPKVAKRPREKKPVRQPVFKPLRFPRLKHTFWAHAAGIAASLLIAAMVLLSVKPVIRMEQFARVSEVEISFPADTDRIPMVMSLPAEGGDRIPLVWIADMPDDEEPSGGKGTIQ